MIGLGRGALCIAALLIAGPVAAQHTLNPFWETGPAENRMDLLVMGDGFDSTEQAKLAQEAEIAIDRIFTQGPYEEYASHFNVSVISTVSNQSGADHPAEAQYVDSFFGCYFDCYDIDRLVCCDYDTIFATAAALYPEFDMVMMVVNDTEYGGSGGPVAITSINDDSADIPPHEFGHSFAGLADEYDAPYPGFVFQDIYPNVSPSAVLDEIKWNYWIDDGTPLPTDPSDATGPLAPVGAYEGASYQTTGLYRPVSNCMMRTLGMGMCPVCTEAIVLSFYGYVEPIDWYTPTQASVQGAAGDTLAFEVAMVQNELPSVEVSWFLDGKYLNSDGSSVFDLMVECIEPGDHNLVALVRDANEDVRVDPDDMLTQQVSWTVTRTDSGGVEECEDLEPPTDAGTPDGGDSGSASDGCGCSNPGRQKRQTRLLDWLSFVF